MKNLILLLEANRECYSTNQIERTMTVGELMELLSEYDEDTPIAISNDNGYTFGSIGWSDFREEEIMEECDESQE